MKKAFVILLLPLMLLACQESSQTSDATSGIFEKLSKEAYAKKLEEKQNEILLDVRTPEEFQKGTISGALNVNFYDADFDQQLSKFDKSKPIFIFCKSGGRSGKTLKKMKALEFKEVYDLKGGYSGWAK